MSATSQTEALKSRMFDLLGSKKKSKRKSKSETQETGTSVPNESVVEEQPVEKSKKKRHKRSCEEAEDTHNHAANDDIKETSATDNTPEALDPSAESSKKSSNKKKKKKHKKKKQKSTSSSASSDKGGEAILTHDTTQQAVPAHNPFEQASDGAATSTASKTGNAEESTSSVQLAIPGEAGNPETQKEAVEQWEKLLSHQRSAAAYLDDWANQGVVTKDGQKVTWKFNKIRQAWLLNHLYDTTLVSDEMFDRTLEYLGKLAGQARKRTLKEARAILACTTPAPQVSKPPVVEVPEPSAPPGEVLEEQKQHEVQIFRAEKLAERLS